MHKNFFKSPTKISTGIIKILERNKNRLFIYAKFIVVRWKYGRKQYKKLKIRNHKKAWEIICKEIGTGEWSKSFDVRN